MYKGITIEYIEKYLDRFKGLLELVDGGLYFIDKTVTPYEMRLMYRSGGYSNIYLASMDSKVSINLTLERGVNSMRIPRKLKLSVMSMGAIFDLGINIYYEHHGSPVYFKHEPIMLEYNRIKTINNIINE